MNKPLLFWIIAMSLISAYKTFAQTIPKEFPVSIYSYAELTQVNDHQINLAAFLELEVG
jgi:hypothetical protein